MSRRTKTSAGFRSSTSVTSRSMHFRSPWHLGQVRSDSGTGSGLSTRRRFSGKGCLTGGCRFVSVFFSSTLTSSIPDASRSFLSAAFSSRLASGGSPFSNSTNCWLETPSRFLPAARTEASNRSSSLLRATSFSTRPSASSVRPCESNSRTTSSTCPRRWPLLELGLHAGSVKAATI